MKTTKTAIVLALAAAICVGSVSAANAGGREPSRDQGTEIKPAPTRPGGDPPYDPGMGPGDVKNPWHPPTGPGEISDTPWTRPQGPGDKAPIPPAPFDPKARVTPVADGCIGGKMIDRSWPDGTWLPSSAWQVHLWIYSDSAGSKLRNDLVLQLDNNGEWLYCIGLGGIDDSKPFLYTYESANLLLRLEDVRDNGHSPNMPYWGGPAPQSQYYPPNNGIYLGAPKMPSELGADGIELPTYAVDTGSSFTFLHGPGPDDDEPNLMYNLGNVLRWGTTTLEKLQTNGIKADRAGGAPHQIEYPTTAEMCNGKVWACYSHQSETVFLDHNSSHVQEFTVQHELAHSVVDQYWADDVVGGAHYEETCDAKANLAYSEGIANFIAIWSHNNDEYHYETYYKDPFNIENPDPGCINKEDMARGQHSEALVAGALWDLYDHGESDEVYVGDTWGSAQIGGIVKLVLKSAARNAPALRVQYAQNNPDFKEWVNAVFDNNFITTAAPDY